MNDFSALERATALQLTQLLTALIRRDRFAEGTLNAAFDSGLLTAILRRAAVLHRELLSGSSPEKNQKPPHR